ncbi:MAG TPA: prepilin-type N-terminal cleavage/methylation domain-containing protein [Candidatus Limnocylindrales bacterium]|nr:prepilin-type N-terminal cleavage/methylation domain-containing protein [Candidatus Limnocylindrales bacterium]
MKPQRKHKFAGFTLLELMIAMAVTLILLYAAVSTFKDASASNQVVTQAADMTENLRAGLTLIEQDLQQAGTGIPVGGVNIPYTSNGSTTSPCSTTAAINRPKLGGTTTFPPCNSTIPAVEPGNMLGPGITAPDATTGTPLNPNSVTDEITILYADNTLGLDNRPINQPATASPPSPGCPAGSLSLSGSTLSVTFDSTCVNLAAAGITIQVGDLVMFNNTNNPNGAILAVTGVAGQTLTFASGDAFGLNGRTDTSGTIRQLETGGPSCGGAASCFPPTTATRVWMVTYYLDNISAPPFVRLVRQVNLPVGNSYPPTPVGETMENLQFTYNFVDGVTNPANQATVPAGNSESQIRSVNVYLAARSSYKVRKGNQSLFARNNMMTQVSLRSLSYVNRYQ